MDWTNDEWDGGTVENGTDDVRRNAIWLKPPVPDFMKPLPDVPDFMRLPGDVSRPQDVYGNGMLPWQQGGPRQWQQGKGLGRGSMAGLWKVRGEDLSLLPGVPVLISSPARPYSDSAIRQAARASVSGDQVGGAVTADPGDGNDGADATNITNVTGASGYAAPAAPGALTGEGVGTTPLGASTGGGAASPGGPGPASAPGASTAPDAGPPPDVTQPGDTGKATDVTGAGKPYTISADGESVSYGAKPYDGMMAAARDGVIAQPGAEEQRAAWTAQQVGEAKAGNKQYGFDHAGGITFDPRHVIGGLDQAMADGVVDAQKGMALREAIYNHPGAGLDAGRAAMYAGMSGRDLRGVVASGELSREDLRGVMQVQQDAAQGKWDQQDNGVNAGQDFLVRVGAKNSELLNRAGEGISHFVGADGVEKWFKTNADVMGDMGRGKFGNVNPSMNNSAHAAVADGLGTLLASTPAMAATRFFTQGAGNPVAGNKSCGLLLQKLGSRYGAEGDFSFAQCDAGGGFRGG